MGKIWLKGPDSDGECCECADRENVCDTCIKELYCSVQDISDCVANSQDALTCALTSLPGFWNYNTVTWSPGQPFPPPGWKESWSGPFLASKNGYYDGPSSNWTYTFLSDKQKKYKKVQYDGTLGLCIYASNVGESCERDTVCNSDVNDYSQNSYLIFKSSNPSDIDQGNYIRAYGPVSSCGKIPTLNQFQEVVTSSIPQINSNANNTSFYIRSENLVEIEGADRCTRSPIADQDDKYFGSYTVELSQEWTRQDAAVQELLNSCCRATVQWSNPELTDECSSSNNVYARWQVYLKNLKPNTNYRFEMPYYNGDEIYSTYVTEFTTEEGDDQLTMSDDVPNVEGYTITAKKWKLIEL